MVRGEKGLVSRRDLAVAILKNTELIGVFTQKQLDELGKGGEQLTIEWPDFLDFIRSTEPSEEVDATGSTRSAEENMKIEDLTVYGELVESQSKALEIELDGRTNLKVTMMDSDDQRVAMCYSNKLIVGSKADAAELALEYARNKSLDESVVPILMDHIERAIIKACQQEIRLLEHEYVTCTSQLENMSDMLLNIEEKMLKYFDDYKRASFIKGVSLGTRRGSIQQDIKNAENNNTSLTPGELARKLSQLQQRTTQKEVEVRHNII